MTRELVLQLNYFNKATFVRWNKAHLAFPAVCVCVAVHINKSVKVAWSGIQLLNVICNTETFV